MRSLLFAPADSDRKLDKAFASGTDAVIIDLENSVALDNKPLARERAARFLMQAGCSAQRPRLIIRVNSLPSGLADADLDAVVPAAPDALLSFLKSEGAASVIHLAAKLTAREAIHGLADGHIRSRNCDRNRRGPVSPRYLCRVEHTACWIDMGCRRSFGGSRRNRQSRCDRTIS